MLKNKLAIFIAKRVLIYYIILSIIDVLLLKDKWHILAGLSAGGVLSVLKFGSYAAVLNGSFHPLRHKPEKSSIQAAVYWYLL